MTKLKYFGPTGEGAGGEGSQIATGNSRKKHHSALRLNLGTPVAKAGGSKHS